LHFLDIVGAASDVNVLVLRVLDAKSIPATLIMAFPPTVSLLEVVSTFAD